LLDLPAQLPRRSPSFIPLVDHSKVLKPADILLLPDSPDGKAKDMICNPRISKDTFLKMRGSWPAVWRNISDNWKKKGSKLLKKRS